MASEEKTFVHHEIEFETPHGPAKLGIETGYYDGPPSITLRFGKDPWWYLGALALRDGKLVFDRTGSISDERIETDADEKIVAPPPERSPYWPDYAKPTAAQREQWGKYSEKMMARARKAQARKQAVGDDRYLDIMQERTIGQ